MIVNIATGPLLPVPPIWGGAAHRLWQGLAEQFAATGHKVTILCRKVPEQPSEEEIKGVAYRRYGGFSQSTNILWDIARDIVHSTKLLPQIPPADILITNDFWLPVVAALRPQIGKVVINAARSPKLQFSLYRQAALIVAPSQAIAKKIAAQTPALQDRVSVIGNPTDVGLFSPAGRKSSVGDRTILYVGRINREKGLELLLEAFALLVHRIEGVRLKIVGPAEENQGGSGTDYLEMLKKRSAKLPVIFESAIFDQHKLAETYRSAGIFCYPSLAERGESFGVSVLEAMASGIAPVVSALPCFTDFVENGANGFVFDHRAPDAARQLSDILHEGLSNPQHLTHASQKAFTTAQRYSYPLIAQQWIDKLSSIL